MKDVLDKIKNYDTHISKHTHQSDIDIMERMLNKEVTNNSGFSEDIDIDQLLKDALHQNQDHIQDWLKNAKQWDRKGFSYVSDQKIGTGIKMDTQTTLIKEYETNNVNIVLKKDKNCETGFSLVTAYPNIAHGDATPTERDLQPVIKKTEHYKNADPVIQTALNYRADPKSKIRITVNAGEKNANDSAIFLSVKDKDDPELTHIIKLKEQTYQLAANREIIDENGRARRQKTTSKYLDLRNETKPMGTAPAFLNNQTIRQAFFNDYPEELKCADYINKRLTQQLSPIQDKTRQTHVQRTKMADKLIHNLKKPDIQNQQQLE